jgi:hypothetical protein
MIFNYLFSVKWQRNKTYPKGPKVKTGMRVWAKVQENEVRVIGALIGTKQAFGEKSAYRRTNLSTNLYQNKKTSCKKLNLTDFDSTKVPSHWLQRIAFPYSAEVAYRSPFPVLKSPRSVVCL